MAIFPVLETELLVQEKDKTRLDASKSYVSGTTAITKIEIKPTLTENFYDVTTTGYLDWEFTHSGGVDDPEANTVTLKVTNAGGNTSITKDILVITETTDNLFSSDDKLRVHETDILRYVPSGRSTFKDVHRRAQSLILAWLDTQGYVDLYDNKFTKEQFKDITEVSEWATMVALRLIFESISNAVDDIFSVKAKRYKGLEEFYRNRAILRIDTDNNGTLESFEGVDIRSCVVVRR